jgi:hypothetical protein
VLEPLHHVGVAHQQALVLPAVVVGGLGQPVLDPVLLVLQGQELLEGQNDLGIDGAARVDDAVLRQVADGGVRGHADLALVRLLGAREHA